MHTHQEHLLHTHLFTARAVEGLPPGGEPTDEDDEIEEDSDADQDMEAGDDYEELSEEEEEVVDTED
jgi:hypothetical protein